MGKPHLFIGSSVEGKAVAEAIQVNLEYDLISTIWHQGEFGISGSTLQSLVGAIKDFDFAALVLTPDDMLVKRGETYSAPRDNVLFELGLFMGYLGPHRTFVIHPRDEPMAIPSDLAGVTTATYEKPSRQTLQAALGAACTKIKMAIASAPPIQRLEGDSPRATVYSELRELRGMVATLIESLASKPSAGTSLSPLAGVWRNDQNDSMLYCRSIDGQDRIVYCYGGNNEATGEYYSWRLVGNELFGRFRWFAAHISGYVWLRIEDRDVLSGGWWYKEDVDKHAAMDPDRLKKAKGMQASTWRRIPGVTYPAWAEEYFNMRRWARP